MADIKNYSNTIRISSMRDLIPKYNGSNFEKPFVNKETLRNHDFTDNNYRNKGSIIKTHFDVDTYSSSVSKPVSSSDDFKLGTGIAEQVLQRYVNLIVDPSKDYIKNEN